MLLRWTNLDADSGMGVVEAQALSGHDWDVSDLVMQYTVLGLKRVEHSGSKLVTYWDEVRQ